MNQSPASRNKSPTVASPSWFQTQPGSRARFRLFCFPYAGGGSGIFRGWVKQLQSTIEVVPALLPGRESRLREPAFTSIDALVDTLSREIVPYLDRPFAFFGHSMGAMIGFELAHRLRAERNLEPVHLFVSGRRAPQLAERDPVIHNLPEPEFIVEVQRLNGTPKEVLEHRELMEILLPMLRADFAVCASFNHVPGAPLSCSLTALGGITDETATREKIEGWCAETTGSCSVKMFEGDHFFINQQRDAILPLIEKTLLTHT